MHQSNRHHNVSHTYYRKFHVLWFVDIYPYTNLQPVTFVADFGYVLQSLLLSHIFFHLRQVHLPVNSSDLNNSPSNISDLQFASHVVANLGAPLHNMFTDSYDEIEEEGQNILFSSNPLAATINNAPIGIPEKEDEDDNMVFAQR
ncbi:hypothetical protein QCA50_015497 [Cerrena zonata]|uniref:Uncharacterized protein n=1 Tax=Cerrena zonata TaxID=2478898 RepID=A0AAW0FIZ8_9APHY